MQAKLDGQVQYKPGGMGVRFVNFAEIGRPLDPAKPQILVYEPAGGEPQLVAAQWFVPLPAAKGRPQPFGQDFDGPMEGHHRLMPYTIEQSAPRIVPHQRVLRSGRAARRSTRRGARASPRAGSSPRAGRADRRRSA